ncbi:MAG: sialidase family protein [Verrucomicrobiae bacterium]|nr:sialidase family protein [Verrucomicrobiae bacterium]
MENIVIYRNDQTYCAFPDIVKSLNGDGLVCFREAPRRDRLGHFDPESKAVLVRSRDGGATWGEKIIICQDADGIQDCSIMRLRGGVLMANFFKWRFARKKESLGDLAPKCDLGSCGFHEIHWAAIAGTYVTRSLDGGKTWTAPVEAGSGKLKALATSAPALECQSGTLLLPVYVNDEQYKNLEVHNGVWVARSKDAGKTWPEMIPVAADAEGKVWLEEPALVQLPSGKILCMMRASVGGGDYLRQAESFDEGETWSPFRKTPMVGHPPHLLRLHDGRLLCTYGYRHEPFGIRARLSRDDGKTWDMEHEIVIRRDGRNADLGYPSSVELEPGKILTVYYFNDETETRFIAGSIFTV